ncbi:hypothetical protein [Methylobacter sp.]|uniref:hypothetical protein n=1 Tax=Methylobacter sp. TaxID=2051955 RepID=UPI003DA60245
MAMVFSFAEKLEHAFSTGSNRSAITKPICIQLIFKKELVAYGRKNAAYAALAV